MNRWDRDSGTGVGRVVLFGLVAAVLVVGISIAGWKLDWFVTNANTNRQAHVIRNGYSNQQTLREEITRKIADVKDMDTQIAAQTPTMDIVPQLTAQRKAIVAMVCQDAAQISGDPLPASQGAFVASNC